MHACSQAHVSSECARSGADAGVAFFRTAKTIRLLRFLRLIRLMKARSDANLHRCAFFYRPNICQYCHMAFSGRRAAGSTTLSNACSALPCAVVTFYL